MSCSAISATAFLIGDRAAMFTNAHDEMLAAHCSTKAYVYYSAVTETLQ